MKFTIDVSDLLSEVALLHKIVPKAAGFPILENLLFHLKGNLLKITASDHQTTVETEISVREVEEEGDFVVPGEILYNALNKFHSGDTIGFSLEKGSYKLEMTVGENSYHVATEDPEEYPVLPELDRSLSVQLPVKYLKAAIQNTLYAISQDEIRPAMAGVLVEIEDDNRVVYFVSTDGHRLVKYTVHLKEGTGTSGRMVIPGKTLSFLKSVLDSHEEEHVKIDFSPSNAVFHLGSRQLSVRLIEERFPDYKRVVQVDNKNKVVVFRKELINCLDRVLVFANRATKQVSFLLEGNKLELSAEDLDYSRGASEALVCRHDGENIRIGFNATFLLDALKPLGSEEIEFQFDLPEKAAVLLPRDTLDEESEEEKKEDIFAMIMPIMLSSTTSSRDTKNEKDDEDEIEEEDEIDEDEIEEEDEIDEDEIEEEIEDEDEEVEDGEAENKE
ncbi:MAG: DNA polymerase III subunit beta [Cytophagales bacterium]|nr:DNA polymerase III subunit beta [Cytophagales bacterium]